jgi:hypothetical protein
MEKVMTPLGVAHLAGIDPVNDMLLVKYLKQDYDGSWGLISPGNGPCVYKLLPAAEVTEIIKLGGPVAYSNRRSGKKYLLLETVGDKCYIRSVETGQAWWTTRNSLETRFRQEVK